MRHPQAAVMRIFRTHPSIPCPEPCGRKTEKWTVAGRARRKTGTSIAASHHSASHFPCRHGPSPPSPNCQQQKPCRGPAARWAQRPSAAHHTGAVCPRSERLAWCVAAADTPTAPGWPVLWALAHPPCVVCRPEGGRGHGGWPGAGWPAQLAGQSLPQK
jgi:hypothetical protein